LPCARRFRAAAATGALNGGFQIWEQAIVFVEQIVAIRITGIWVFNLAFLAIMAILAIPSALDYREFKQTPACPNTVI
jgi:hypothetical protein